MPRLARNRRCSEARQRKSDAERYSSFEAEHNLRRCRPAARFANSRFHRDGRLDSFFARLSTPLGVRLSGSHAAVLVTIVGAVVASSDLRVISQDPRTDVVLVLVGV